ncbi:hypothetical protein JKP88DRAFT_320900, partial [Tribonema minus]
PLLLLWLAFIAAARAFVLAPSGVTRAAARSADATRTSSTRCALSVQPVEGLDAGVVLVASKNDYGHFTMKSVALVFEYSMEASKAVVLDRGSPFTIGEMTSLDMGPLANNRLYRGGEDGGSAVVMIHMRGDLAGAQQIGDSDLFVGGLQAAKEAVASGQAQASEFKFFFNFMRWSPGGLEEQVEKGKWSTIFLDKSAIMAQASNKDQELW